MKRFGCLVVVFACLLGIVFLLANLSFANKPKELASFPVEGKVVSLSFSPNGKLLATGAETLYFGPGKERGGGVAIWDISTGLMVSSSRQGQSVNSVKFSPDGKRLAAGCALAKPGQKSSGGVDLTGGEVAFYDTVTFQEQGKIELKSAVLALAYSPDGKTMATANWNPDPKPSGVNPGEVILWDVATLKERVTLQGIKSAWVRALAFSLDSKSLAVGDVKYGGPISQGEVKIYDVASGVLRNSLMADDSYGVKNLAFSPDGQFLAASADSVRLWNTATWKPPTRGDLSREGTDGPLSISPDSKILAASRYSYGSHKVGHVFIWDLQKNQKRVLWKMDLQVSSLAFSPDGKTLAAGAGMKVLIWAVPPK